jgi:tRNA 2-thiouridine synthesizing protein E
VPTDRDGHLVALDDWNPSVAAELARVSGIELTPRHWEIVRLARDFHAQHDLVPTMRALVKWVRVRLGEDAGNSIYLMELFPGSPARLVARIAGLPRPTNCL